MFQCTIARSAVHVWRLAACAVVGFCVSSHTLVPVSDAGILSRILREAGEAGGKAGKHGFGSLDQAAAVVRALPDSKGDAALAVHASPEGHWTFINKKGEQFTAGTASELDRAAETLLGQAGAADGKLRLYLTGDTVFKNAGRIGDLPGTTELHIATGTSSFKLIPHRAAPLGYRINVRPSLNLNLQSKVMLDEALYRLRQPIKPANIRVLALEPGGPKHLSSVPSYDPASKVRLTEAADPANLAQALSGIRGQTVVLTGLIKDGRLQFRPRKGPQGSLPLETLASAAKEADVNLIVLRSSSPSQPGVRTWLWQTVEVAGLESALKRPTFADFLDSVASQSGQLVINVQEAGRGRLRLRAFPSGATAVTVKDYETGWLDVISEQITGTVATQGVSAYLRDRERTEEYQLRVVPGIPSTYQIAYVVCLIAGLIGFGVARSWWRSLWPNELRNDYGNRFGYHAARCVRAVAFLLVFLPIAGVPALIWAVLRPVIAILSIPLRLIGTYVSRSRT